MSDATWCCLRETTWTEWGVRRTWGPQAGTVASFECDRRTAEICAAEWPGELVERRVVAGSWTPPATSESTTPEEATA